MVPEVGDVMLASFVPPDVKISQVITPAIPWYGGIFLLFLFHVLILPRSIFIYYFFVFLTIARWVGEKYDGIRCIWNNTEHKL